MDLPWVRAGLGSTRGGRGREMSLPKMGWEGTFGSHDADDDTPFTRCSLRGRMAMQALPPAAARALRTPAHAPETVDTSENGASP